MDSRDLSDEQRVKLVAELEQRRAFFARLLRRMKARQWYLDSAVLNAVEAAWNATAAAINALRAEKRLPPIQNLTDKPFQLPQIKTEPPPSDAYNHRRSK